jgi:hypothetical protein
MPIIKQYGHTSGVNMGLSTIQRATLQALAEECSYSLSAHVPEGAVTRHFPTHLRGDAKKALDQLRRMGFSVKHPTGRNTTWGLTQLGLTSARTFLTPT